jgi:hypothetical protein
LYSLPPGISPIAVNNDNNNNNNNIILHVKAFALADGISEVPCIL